MVEILEHRRRLERLVGLRLGHAAPGTTVPAEGGGESLPRSLSRWALANLSRLTPLAAPLPGCCSSEPLQQNLQQEVDN